MLQKFDRKLSAEEVYFGSKTPTLSVANKTNQKFFRKKPKKAIGRRRYLLPKLQKRQTETQRLVSSLFLKTARTKKFVFLGTTRAIPRQS